MSCSDRNPPIRDPAPVATAKKETVVKPKPSEVTKDTQSVAEDKPRGDFRFEEDSRLAQLNGRIVTSRAVEELMPTDTSMEFRVGQRVYVFAALSAPQAETIHFDWVGPDGPVLPSSYLDVEANTGPVGYRIYTYRVFRKPGSYRVDLINSGGNTIGTTRFTLTK